MTIGQFLKQHRRGATTLALLGMTAYLWFRPPAWVEDLHQPAPAVSWQTTEGVDHLADLSGKVVLVNFWGAWCPFCRIEMPAMQAFYRDWQEQGFDIVAFSLDEDHAVTDAYMRSQGFTFPAPAADDYTRSAFGRVEQVPTSFIIDRHGVIRHRIEGQLHYDRLERLVSPLLAETGSEIESTRRREHDHDD
jgi:thiol-disulfide isomerase/thioredoxin